VQTAAPITSAQTYRPRHPERSVLYRALAHHFERFLLVYEDRFQDGRGYLRRCVEPAIHQLPRLRYLRPGRRLWVEFPLDLRRRMQRVLLPEGLVFDGEAFRTPVSCLFFSDLERSERDEYKVVSPRGLVDLYQAEIRGETRRVA